MAKALSILQPWAWLIVNRHKEIENRRWPTRYRGRLLVHAGKKWGREQREDMEWVRENFPHIVLPQTFELGGIVGETRIVACVTRSISRWFFGPYGFELADSRPLPFVPLRGQLGMFEVAHG